MGLYLRSGGGGLKIFTGADCDSGGHTVLLICEKNIRTLQSIHFHLTVKYRRTYLNDFSQINSVHDVCGLLIFQSTPAL